MKLILASGSPRRRELITRMGVPDYTVVSPDVDETMPANTAPDALVRALSARKAAAVDAPADAVVVAADTVVALDGAVMGKPKDEADAKRMLRALSGRTHQVYTGVTVRRGGKTVTEHEVTAVTFRPLTDGEIDAYVRGGEPMDKAGAYGVQGQGALLVERIEGDYYNVMGLPVCHLGRILGELGLPLLGK